MTPQELDDVIDAVDPTTCQLCAARISTYPDTMICPDCTVHLETDHPEAGLDAEPRAEQFLIAMGLTNGSKFLPSIELSDNAFELGLSDRMRKIFWLMQKMTNHSEARRCMIRARYCAHYIPHTVDSLVACRGGGLLPSFDCFIWLLSELRPDPFWTRYLLSDDPRARSGNVLALVVAEQMALHAPGWERDADAHPDPPQIRMFMGNVLYVLGFVLAVQVDKAAAVQLPARLWEQVRSITARWKAKWSRDEKMSIALARLTVPLQKDDYFYEYSRGLRDSAEGMQKCARVDCLQATSLYQCAQCQVALYCSREHQADDWRQGNPPHRQRCYSPCF